MSALRGIIDLLFPPRCQVCRTPGLFPLCAACRSAIRVIHPPVCRRCGRPLRGPSDLLFTCITCRRRRPHFSAARAAGVYDGALREAIHAFKFGRRRALAAPLGRLMAQVARRDPQLQAADLIVPVPLHRRRFRERGFNQSALLASEVAADVGFPLAEDLLIKLRAAPPQSGLLLKDRRQNVRGAFTCAGPVHGAVILVDDVISTGFTVSECARILCQAGAARVVVLTAAMAVPE